jgi:uncharacterized protein YdhG (YjbR/CyaY superfamily)
MNPVDAYIADFEPEIQTRLQELRAIFLSILPETAENLRYKIPAYKVGNNHLYFAAYKKYIGFYPVYGLADIEPELAAYRAKNTKDTLHFPHNEDLPVELIRKIIGLKIL